MRLVAILLSVSLATGCATASKNISSSYVSPMQYNNYTCEQLSQEASNIQARVSEVGGAVDSKAHADKWITGAGIVLFWPALFFVGNNKDKEAEFSRLKGEYEAVQKAAVQKQCFVKKIKQQKF